MSNVKMIGGIGQSIWLDYIDRELLNSGKLVNFIEQDGIRGMTSNPAIFQKAISNDPSYADAIRSFARQGDAPSDIYEKLAIHDIQQAADQLRPVYDRTDRRDGYVSLEVSPKLACDTDGTIVEAHRLWAAVGRPNLMIKVPATHEGMPAITQLISDAINVNVTLLFSQEMYAKAAEAYLSGLEQLSGKQASLQGIASVASFFVSRIDAEVEKAASALLKSEDNADNNEQIEHLLGKVAIANAKMAYQQYQKIVSSSRWENLAGQGAEPQRLLWASTGTKNSAYSDVLYIEELIGPDTVNTAPPGTLDAFRDHGRVRTSLQEDVAEADAVLRQMEKVGISLDEITELLLENGIKLFDDAYDALIDIIASKVSEYKLKEQKP